MTATSRRKVLSSVAVGAGTWMLQRKALSQAGGGSGTWPSRPVRLVVAFPPGGLTDAWARLYAEQFQAATGQPCVVENKPGAGGNIAIDLVGDTQVEGDETFTLRLVNPVNAKALPPGDTIQITIKDDRNG